MLVEVGRCDERLAGHARVAGVVAEAQADAVGFRETPAEVAAERAVEEAIVRSLAGSFKIGRRGRIIKTAHQPAQLRSAARGGESAAFGQQNELWPPRRAAVGEDLHHAGHGVGAVQRAFSPAHHLDLLHIVQSEIGKIDGAAGFVHGGTVH